MEAEKKRSPCTMTEKPAPSPRKPTLSTTPKVAVVVSDTRKEKERPKYDDKHKAELSLKGACFNCEQVGHMARDCLKKGSVSALEANEESGSESGKDDP